jgi:hypothetical protein
MPSHSFQIDNVLIEIEEAPLLRFPASIDSNSPTWWSEGQLHILNSIGHSVRSSGPNLERLARGAEIRYNAWRDGGRWMESVHQEPDGTLFGWYHNEPAHYLPEALHSGRQVRLTAPFIGAAVSYDNGATWDDLGLVLSGAPEWLELERPNFWFAGGNGDFSVILDRSGETFYFLFGAYYKDPSQQGIALARLSHAHLRCPVGQVWKWHAGGWGQPGLNGMVTPVLPVRASWYDPAPDTFWGPSVHWNTAIQQYVILLNRAVDPRWRQEGIYLCLSPDISDPTSWTPPLRLLGETGWYPQVISADPARRESDRQIGADGRLFIHGESKYAIRFSLRGS